MFDLSQPPLVDGHPTTLHRLTYAEFGQSPFLEPLYELVNAAFATTHIPPYWPEGDLKRLHTASELVDEMDPTAITYILTQSSVDGDLRVVGSICEEVFDAQPRYDAAAGMSPFKDILYQDVAPREASVAQRMIRSLVVDPALMGKGIGGWLLEYAIAQIQAQLSREGRWTGARLVLSAIYEINGRYYDKRGWKTVAKRVMPPGYLGSPAGFSIVRMERDVALGGVDVAK
ncbi:hypothetical protein EXIGLDRAFT_729812 [Exidia glandulosa HHB12029]|uniref:N-acetyltransferase domain-containing protein n=1 Tax=Exidia glandulosa HHB12029 TaxID=1314781 RepID=A0A165CF51_EXIGL|nr:hypothetical protein EXIGLDRAFT_729812 [Exidia glandulosa HHB12029]